MRKWRTQIAILTMFIFVCGLAAIQASAGSEPVEVTRYEDEFSTVHVEPGRMVEKTGLAVIFEGTKDMHYYAKKETAAGGYNLKVSAKAEGVTFGDAIFGKWGTFFDTAQGKNVEVYAGNFTIFIPIEVNILSYPFDVEVTVEGIACTSKICLAPFEHKVQTRIDYSQIDL